MTLSLFHGHQQTQTTPSGNGQPIGLLLAVTQVQTSQTATTATSSVQSLPTFTGLLLALT